MTGMESFVDPMAGGLVGILVDTAKKVGGNFAQILGDRARAYAALKQYANKYSARYGTLKLLGMQRSVPLETIYTKVRFLSGLSIRQFTSLEALEKSYRQDRKRRFQIHDSSKLDAPIVINETQFLMVLGGPGAGKSTFLRRTGLEALKGDKGSLKHRNIPVMLELKRLTSQEVCLTKAVAEELSHFGFPKSEEFTVKLLEQGKLLLLLDGLDEIPRANSNTVVDAIQDFVTQYDKNRYIASCRIAAHRSTWSRFRDIELADFDNHQIQQFIYNWFHSELDREFRTAEKCWETLNKSRNSAAKELAQTPLLLTFLCMVYDRTQGFPVNRAILYRKALDILLEEWAAEKRIRHETIYEGLNPDLEKVLLAEISYNGFVEDQLFFTQEELVSQIKSFLSDTVDKPKYLDGRAILNAIAIQQGILVERAEDIFSFSHLTLQEYLTAQYLSQEPELLQDLVQQCSIDQRWREVLLLVSGLLQNSDKLMQFMKAKADTYLKTPKIKAILTWISQNTSESNYGFRSSVERSIIFAIFSIFANFKSENFTKTFNTTIAANNLATSLDLQSFQICHLIQVLAGFLVSLRDLVKDLDILVTRHKESILETRLVHPENYHDSSFDEQILYYGNDNNMKLPHFEDVGGLSIIDHPEQGSSVDAGEIVRASESVCQYFDDLITVLQELNLFDKNIRQEISEIRISEMKSPELSKSSGGAVLRHAQDFLKRGSRIWRETLSIPEEWIILSEEEVELLSNYLYITELMVRCKESAVRVSEKVWTGIEEKILVSTVD